MVAGDRATGTVRSEQTTTTSGRTLRECKHRIAELEAKNERLTRELAEREQDKQEIIDHYERVIRTRRRGAKSPQDAAANEGGLLARVRRLLS